MRALSAVFLTGAVLFSAPNSSTGFRASRNPVTVAVPTQSSSGAHAGPANSVAHPSVYCVRVRPAPNVLRQSFSGGASPSSLGAFPVPTEVLTSFLPPALGFGKSEWTVSYGYGFATALSGLSILLKDTILPKQPWTIASAQAAALVFYGFRLNAFLFLRNRLSPTYRDIGQQIEEKASERYATRLARTPFVLSCGLLYYGLYLPVLFTTRFAGDALAVKTAGGVGTTAMKLLVGLQWFGYVLAALGDLTKSFVKAREKNGKFLVTSGIFSVLRHPNFTGEIVAWTANGLCGGLAGAYLLRSRFSLARSLSLPVLGGLGLSALGTAGMIFVLLRATSNLEEKQKKQHGTTKIYKQWIETTWCGWKLSPPETKENEGETPHEITMNANVDEDFGSGI